MSRRFGRPDRRPSTLYDTGFEALQSTAEFCGPVEPLDGHEDNDHFALIYEDRTEQLATAVPFVRQGLERGERCMYIVDDNSRDELVAALRDGGVDADAVLDSGQLSVHSVEETYLANGEFDLDHARDLLRTAMEEALDEYEGFRVTAEETWLVDDKKAQTEFLTCEAHVNDLIEGESGMALCQYDRTQLPPEVIEDVINTHPYLVYDGTACPNDYYTPPEEYFGPDRPARENQRKLETLVGRTDARASLRSRERHERELYEITSDPDRSFEEKLDALFDLGCEWFDMDLGGLAKVDPDTDLFEVEVVSGDHDNLVPGAQADLSETYCRVTTDRGSADPVADPVGVTDPIGDGFEGKLCYEKFGVRAYLGSYLELEDGPDRTFWFVSNAPRADEFSGAERTFHQLMGQWVQYELERRQRERQLREREQHLRALVETTPECIKTVAADGTLLQMNPAGLDMVEADSAPDVIGECVYDLIAPEHRDRFREFNERICRGERGTLEFDIVGLEGGRRHMETHAAPLDRPDGTTAHVALTRDVTERKERERELRRKERRFEAIFEDPNILVGLLDLDGTVLDINETAMEYIDADFAEVTGEPFWETPWWGEGDEVRSDVREWIERAAAGEYVDFEADLTRPNGGGYTVDGVFRPVTNDDGDVVSVIVSDRDVTDRKERQRALEQSEQRYRTLAEAFPNGVVGLFDGDLRYTLATGQAFEHLPVSSDDVTGRTPREAWDDDVADELEPACRAALDGERDSIEVSFGGREWVVYVVPITDEDGDVFAGMTMAQDITERKENQRKLRKQNERLESFASMLAHELRNPVTIGQIYSRQLPAETNPEAVGYVAEAFDRIEDMIDVMLVLTRGREAVGERTPVDLAETVREAWDDVDAPEAALDVTVARTIQADGTYIRHLFSNLLKNAVEHGSTSSRSQAHEDAVEHGGDDVSVTVGELSTGFYVEDDGIGIPPDERDAIFDEGYTTAPDNGGTGLGLAFVRKLTEVYEWDCTVTESDAGGARFEFRNVA